MFKLDVDNRVSSAVPLDVASNRSTSNSGDKRLDNRKSEHQLATIVLLLFCTAKLK